MSDGRAISYEYDEEECITRVTDSNYGNILTKNGIAYTYDAWGKCTITQDTTVVGIATINPFRYRGYYFDTETGLYYLQSRYYDPETARFLNSDSPEYITIVPRLHWMH